MSFFYRRKRVPTGTKKRPVAKHASVSTKASPLVETQSVDKTKVLLALGSHGYVHESDSRIIGMSKDFFKGVAVPFLEEYVGGKDSVMIIFEHTIGDLQIPSCLAPTSAMLDLDRFNEEIARQLELTLNRGLPPADFFDWGFSDLVAHLNSGQRRILCLPEALTPEVVVKDLDFYEIEAKIRRLSSPHDTFPNMGLFPFYLMKKRLLLESALLRDEEVVRMASDFRDKNPNSSILILRGLAHKQMRVLFDPEIFEVVVESEGNYHPDFLVDAGERFYQGNLSDSELGLLVKQEMVYDFILRSAGVNLCKAAHRRQTGFFRQAAEEALEICSAL